MPAFGEFPFEENKEKSASFAAEKALVKTFPSQAEEVAGIILELEGLLKNGIRGDAIAIIYPDETYGSQFSECLKEKGLSIRHLQRLDILDQPLIRQLMLVLHFMAAEQDVAFSGDEMLFRILHFPFWGIPASEIAKASLEAFARKADSFRQFLHQRLEEMPSDLFWQPLPESVRYAVARLEGLIASVQEEPLTGLVERAAEETGFFVQAAQAPELQRQLQGFLAFVKEEAGRNPQWSLEELMSHIAQMHHKGMVLPLRTVSGAGEGVQLLDVHECRDHRFDYVFLAGCTATAWENRPRPFEQFSMAALPAEWDVAASEEVTKAFLQKERYHLFAEAVSCARKQLLLSYSKLGMDEEPLAPSRFIADLRETLFLPEEKSPPDLPFHCLLPESKARLAPRLPALDEELEQRALQGFSLSVSALNSFLRCPLAFYYHYVVRMPSARNEAAEFGSAVHYALEQLFRKMQAVEAFPPVEVLLNDFAEYMYRHRKYFTRAQFEHRLARGHKTLAHYYRENRDRWNKVVAVERMLRNVFLDDVVLKGKIDKIEFNGRQALIVDYKTGNLEKALENLKGPCDAHPNGGDYWRQAVFYKLLVELYAGRDWSVAGVQFDFVEPDRQGAFHKENLLITKADEATVKNQIHLAWDRIRNRDFYTGCGKENCPWCRFVQMNRLAVAFQEVPANDAFGTH